MSNAVARFAADRGRGFGPRIACKRFISGRFGAPVDLLESMSSGAPGDADSGGASSRLLRRQRLINKKEENARGRNRVAAARSHSADAPACMSGATSALERGKVTGIRNELCGPRFASPAGRINSYAAPRSTCRSAFLFPLVAVIRHV